MVLGLDSHLTNNNNEQVIQNHYIETSLKTNSFTESGSQSPISTSSEDSGLFIKNYEPRFQLSFSQSSEILNTNEMNSVESSNSSSEIKNSSSVVKEDTKAGNETYHYFVDENMDEEALIKHILNLHGGEISAENKHNIDVTTKKPLEDNTGYITAPTVDIKTSFHEELTTSSSRNSRSDVKSRGYHREFKNSRSRESLNRSSSDNFMSGNRSFSRDDIRKEFKQSKVSFSLASDNKNSFSRTDISHEFKKTRNNNNINDIERKRDNVTKGNFSRNLRNEFKRTKASFNSLRSPSRDIFESSENLDNDLDGSKNSLDFSEIISQVDIKNPRIRQIQSECYNQEFKQSMPKRNIQVSPINFPRSEDSSKQSVRRMNRGYQRYENQQPEHAYSTQSLPQIDQDEDLLEITQPTMSLNEPGNAKLFKNKLLNRQQDKTKINGKSKIDLELLDDQELDSLKQMLKMTNEDLGPIEQSILSSVLKEMRQESDENKKRDNAWKKLKLCLETEAINEIIEDVGKRSLSADEEKLSENETVLKKLVEMLEPVIRRIVREEVQRCVSELIKN